MLFPLGTIILAVSLLQLFETIEIVWLHELFAKQQVFFLNLIFDLGARVEYLDNTWFVTISKYTTVYINNGCVGLPAISVFFAVILFTPHSQDPKTNKTIIWRKAITIVSSILLIFFFNVFRAVIQFVLYSRGYAWSVVHDSQGALAIIIVVHISIFLLCIKFLPEWYVSIYYSGKLILKQLKKTHITEIFNSIKQKNQTDQTNQGNMVRQLFNKESIDFYLIEIYEIDSRLIQFLKENKNKYTIKAIKNHLFHQQEKITEDFLEKILCILVDADLVFSEQFDENIYYFI
ncbi:MAG: exosortase/archaeosortase family protein [Candidatus Hodarchaeota archaeon]